MKQRSLCKNRFLIDDPTQKIEPMMGKGTFMPNENKYRILLKKMALTVMVRRRGLQEMATNLL